MILNQADNIYLGTSEVDKVYLGSAQVWPLLLVNLYDQNDVCSIGANETESIGAGWTPFVETQVELLISQGNSSDWSLRARKIDASQNSPNGTFGGRVTITLGGFEIGETYRLTADTRALNSSEDAVGRGWLEVQRGTGNHAYFDIESFEWVTQSFDFVADETTVEINMYASWHNAGGSIQGESTLVDNIFIEKIS